MTSKPSNPKDQFGVRKVPLMSVIPTRVLAGPALGMLEGALKYGRHNYRQVGVRASVYVDAATRHIASWWEGEDIDPDSGLSHIDKAICSLMVLRDGMYEGNWQDDRPPKTDPAWISKANKHAEKLIDKYPDPKAPITAIKTKMSDAEFFDGIEEGATCPFCRGPADHYVGECRKGNASTVSLTPPTDEEKTYLDGLVKTNTAPKPVIIEAGGKIYDGVVRGNTLYFKGMPVARFDRLAQLTSTEVADIDIGENRMSVRLKP